MINLRRRFLPNFGVLSDEYNYDPKRLLESYIYSVNTNKDKNLNHHLVINSVEKHGLNKFYGSDESGYEQINLTSYDLIDSSNGYEKSNWQWFTRSDLSKEEKKNYYRKNLQQKLDNLEETIESSYSKINDLSDEYLKNILSGFKGKVTRVRWAVANPGMEMQPHIDYDTYHAVRYHLPVITNPDATISVSRNGVEQKIHMPVEGKVFFVNQGFKHWIENHGDSSRVHLIVTVVGQEDLTGFSAILS